MYCLYDCLKESWLSNSIKYIVDLDLIELHVTSTQIKVNLIAVGDLTLLTSKVSNQMRGRG